MLGDRQTGDAPAGDVAPEPEAEPTEPDPPGPDASVATLPVERPDADDPVAPESEPTAENDGAEPATEDGSSPIMTAVPALAEEDGPIENTSEMVGQLWTSGTTAGPLDDWEPDEMNKKVKSSRPFRWTSLVGVLLVIGLIAVGLVVLPSIARSRADDHRSMLTTALAELRAELPATQTSLAVATDPASSTESLGALSTQLTTLAATTSTVDTAAQAELPSAPPFTSSAPIDELEPIRQRLEPLGTVAGTIQRRISDVVEYRTLMDDFLNLPDLPIMADASAQAELRVTLAAAQADSAAILVELPDDVSLDGHRASARDLSERFATWQVDYLEALRTEDSVLARQLLAELGDGLAALDNELVTPLAQIRRQTDADLIELARSIDEVVALANGDSAQP